MLSLVFLILAILFLIFTLAPLSRYEIWWIRGWDFPRFQMFVASFILVFIEFLVLDLTVVQSQIAIVIGLFCTIYLAWWILPYTKIFKKEVDQANNIDSESVLRIMVANVLITNREASKLLDLVEENKPDILVTLESNLWWQEKLDILENEYSHTIKYPLENSYGMHVYSKLQLTETEISFLIEQDIPSMRGMVVLPSGKRVQVYFLHPAPPSPTENESSVERDAELLIIAKEVSKKEVPVIVAGDMNDVAWSYTTRLFRKISGLLDPRIGRGMFNTFHAEYFFIRWPLDHLFHSSHFQVAQIKRLPYFGSDHFPILVELALTDENGGKAKGLDATPDNEEEAEEKIKNRMDD